MQTRKSYTKLSRAVAISSEFGAYFYQKGTPTEHANAKLAEHGFGSVVSEPQAVVEAKA